MRNAKAAGYGFWLAALVAAAGCGSNKTASLDGGDARGDVQPDAAAEVSLDVAAETAPDAAAETAPDATPETAPDAAAETAPDATPETAPDATAEVDPVCNTISVAATRTVHLRITADNECDVFVNGALAGSTSSWSSPVTLDVSLFIHPGRVNVIGVVARNTSSQSGPDRGLIGQLDDLADGGSKVVIVTDDSWKTSKVERSGWPALLFDDADWAAATVVGAHGDAPWSALLGTSNAKWLWSAPIPANTADKPNAETAYFRKKFYFGTDGTTIATTPACPVVAP